jgi:hypothetical protein
LPDRRIYVISDFVDDEIIQTYSDPPETSLWRGWVEVAKGKKCGASCREQQHSFDFSRCATRVADFDSGWRWW